MSSAFASGKHSIAMCDVCGCKYKLTELKVVVVKTKRTGILACPTCWDPDHPQLMLGMYPVNDPQAVRNPRNDTTYVTAGVNSAGYKTGGSRDIQWGWAPVGGGVQIGDVLTPNYLATSTDVGTVTITTA